MRQFVLLLLFLSVSCSSSEEVIKREAPFFDLKGYFSEEVKKTFSCYSSFPEGTKSIQLSKSVSINGKEEIQQAGWSSLETDLELFLVSDINKPSWYDAYAIDSVGPQGNPDQVRYTALDEKLRTKKITVDYVNRAVSGIVIENEVSNMITSSKQLLKYKAVEGYEIKLNQKAVFTPEKEIIIKMSCSN